MGYRSVVLGLLLFSSSLDASPAFQDAWYYEVMLGEVSTALTRYQEVVRNTSLPLELRRRAFLRSGRCAEKLGRFPRAKHNYRQVISNATDRAGVRKEEADSLSRSAAARLKILAYGGGQDDTKDATLGRLEIQLQRALDARRSAHTVVVKSLERHERADRGAARIEDFLAPKGIHLVWDPLPGETVLDWRSAEEDGSAVEYLTGLGLDDVDRKLLRAELAHRFYVRAIRALVSLELRSTLEYLRLHTELAVVRRAEALHLTESLQQLLGDVQGLRNEASDLLRAENGRRRAEVLHGIREISGAGESTDADDALAELVSVELREDWAPTELLAAGRLREHTVASARSLGSLLGAANDDRFQELQSECHQTARDLASDLEKLFLLSRDPTMEQRPRLADASTMTPRVRRLVEDVLARQSRVSRRSDEMKMLLGDLLRLLDWFPDVDQTGSYGDAVQRLLQR